MNTEKQPQLVRAIGRWTLTALVINLIIASGIFGLPAQVAKLVGNAAPLACLIAAAGMGVIMACFAEVASQFREAGGPYLYARSVFGPFAGIQMGWLAWLVRLTSAAANANLFVIYLAEFWPQATQPVGRASLLVLLIGLLAAVNVRGIRGGARLSTIFTVGKLVPLFLFIGVGIFFLRSDRAVLPVMPGGAWFEALLALVFAYGGFEAALMPMGEVKNPERDAPFALFTGLAVVAVVYTLVHVIVLGVLTDPTASDRPLAAAAGVFLGAGGAAGIAVGALVSVYGQLSGQMLSAPRLIFALAEQKDFPEPLARIHPRFHTPHISILVHTALFLALAVYGNFYWNVILSAVARLVTYGIVCAALIALRVRQPRARRFRLPAGGVFAALGMAFCGVLLLSMNLEHLRILSMTIGLALIATRRRR